MLSGNEILAIDAGTQGVSLILWCPVLRKLHGVGEKSYKHDALPGLPDGHLEQSAGDWTEAIREAMVALRDDVRTRIGDEIERVAAIGVTGHMHCMVRKDADEQKPFGCDLWNDPRGVSQSEKLSKLLGEHMPARWTACHILARMQDDPDDWAEVAGVSVTSGSIVHDLTGQWVLGPGDATGTLDAKGSTLLGGLPIGTPVAPPEGDQQSVLVVSAAGEMELALSAGTSFTGNLPASVAYTAKPSIGIPTPTSETSTTSAISASQNALKRCSHV